MSNWDLAQRQGGISEEAAIWSNLHDSQMMRRAAVAAMNYDVDELQGLVKAYLAYGSASGVLTSPRTVEAYVLGVRQWVLWAQNNAVSLLSPSRHAGQNYVNHMVSAGRAPAGVGLKVAAAGCFYRALRWTGATEAKPFQDVRVPKDRVPGIVKRPPYSDEELAKVIAAGDDHSRFLLFVVAHGGLRISEALGLEWRDIDEEHRRLRVRNGKGRKDRVVAMSKTLAAASLAYRRSHGIGCPLFDPYGGRATPPERVFRYATRATARHHLEKIFLKAGVQFRGFHPGRKYAGTRLMQQIGDFGRVAAHLGHESVDTTRRGYVQLEADHLRDALEDW